MLKYIFPLLFASTAFVGCADSKIATYENLQTSSKNEYQKHIKEIAMTSEAIVIFKKGVSYEKAIAVVGSYDMKVKHYYKTLSKRNNKHYMLLGSSMSVQRMLQLLKSDPLIQSVSLNYRQTIDTIHSSSK